MSNSDNIDLILDRIEKKIDKISEVIESIREAERRIDYLDDKTTEHSNRIKDLEEALGNLKTFANSHKYISAALAAGVVGIIAALIILH
jgi:DNA repair exonuclease SbcCD ATPase subunit